MLKQDPAIHDQLLNSQSKNMQEESARVRKKTNKIIDLMLLAEWDTKTCGKTDSWYLF